MSRRNKKPTPIVVAHVPTLLPRELLTITLPAYMTLDWMVQRRARAEHVNLLLRVLEFGEQAAYEFYGAQALETLFSNAIITAQSVREYFERTGQWELNDYSYRYLSGALACACQMLVRVPRERALVYAIKAQRNNPY